MDGRVRMGLAVAGGYVLGRTKKARLAITLAGLMAGRKLNSTGGLVGQGVEMLRSPEFEQLRDDVRGRLMGAGKTAALATASNTMRRATERLSAPPELEDEDEPDEEEEVEEERPRRSRSRRSERRGDGADSGSGRRSRPAGRREPQKKAPAKRASSASKRPAKKAAKKTAKKTPARKSTSSSSSRSSRGTSSRSRRNG